MTDLETNRAVQGILADVDIRQGESRKAPGCLTTGKAAFQGLHKTRSLPHLFPVQVLLQVSSLCLVRLRQTIVKCSPNFFSGVKQDGNTLILPSSELGPISSKSTQNKSLPDSSWKKSGSTTSLGKPLHSWC